MLDVFGKLRDGSQVLLKARENGLDDKLVSGSGADQKASIITKVWQKAANTEGPDFTVKLPDGKAADIAKADIHRIVVPPVTGFGSFDAH